MDIGAERTVYRGHRVDFLLIERALRMAGLLGAASGSKAASAERALLQSRWTWCCPIMQCPACISRTAQTLPPPLSEPATDPGFGTIGEVSVRDGGSRAWDYVPKSRLRRLVPAVRRAIERAAAQAARRPAARETAPNPAGPRSR